MPLTYDIIENNSNLEVKDQKKKVNNYKHTEIDNDIILAMKTDYNLNYNLSYLNLQFLLNLIKELYFLSLESSHHP